MTFRRLIEVTLQAVKDISLVIVTGKQDSYFISCHESLVSHLWPLKAVVVKEENISGRDGLHCAVTSILMKQHYYLIFS